MILICALRSGWNVLVTAQGARLKHLSYGRRQRMHLAELLDTQWSSAEKVQENTLRLN
jgi:ABC-type hemin transport system ATPase subunit